MDRDKSAESAGQAPDISALPALVVGAGQACWRAGDGSLATIGHREALRRIRAGPAPLVCHAPSASRRLGIKGAPFHDVLELFAFTCPARFCVPTVAGLAAALDLAPAPSPGEEPGLLVDVAVRLLAELGHIEDDPRSIAEAMDAGGWRWGRAVLRALAPTACSGPGASKGRAGGLEIWRSLPEWAERAPEPPPANQPVEPDEARARLAALLGKDAEARPQQADYASAVTTAFQPRDKAGAPHVVLADAGTGVGKTLGYIAPASVWAEKNKGTVWISTFTRNLQHQIDQELDRLYPDRREKARKVAVRMGRENYLCLLNYEEAVGAAHLRSQDAVCVGLIARWASHSRGGAMIGGDFAGWLADLVGWGRALGLADRRGECIYSACAHYTRCFIEHGIRRARRAEIVVANHALVMIQAAHAAGGAGADERLMPTRYVFDEGHHVFGAADSAFSGHLTGQEAGELRRWIRGAERAGGGRGRARGLRSRIGDLSVDDGEAEAAIEAARQASLALPGENWLQRLAAGQPAGKAEIFLDTVRRQVEARAGGRERAYGIECETLPPLEGLLDAAGELDRALAALALPLGSLAKRLAARLDEEADDLDSATRNRLDAMARGLKRRLDTQIAGWRSMLAALGKDEVPPEFVDWFSIEREFGRDSDIGMHRHWVDPGIPFAEHVLGPAHGAVITSASLRDGSGDEARDWAAAEAQTGVGHLPAPALRASVPSPFDYAALTKVIVVTDVRRDDVSQVAGAYRALFAASGGGGLGLFTAISRLAAVHQRIAGPLEEAGLALYAQHLDGLDVSTLVDIFRAERDACLLGTDAVRDGVDVPGASLRLIVFDRVPWPRPTLLHKARRQAFGEAYGKAAYDDMIVRLRLKQAFGRLVRRATDHGVFVLLDSRLPSRLASAFPEGVEIERLGLAEAVARTKNFLAGYGSP
ncbi:MAG: ATP-dependent DNA helicase [Alphaproteobacteria bacterium]